MKTRLTSLMRAVPTMALFIVIGYQLSASAADEQINRLIVFGDGYSDTGNSFNNTVGDDGIGMPPSPAYFDGRASNGPVWVEHLAAGLDLPVPEPVIVGGTNYAWLGAGTDPDSSTQGAADIGKQINAYLMYGNVPAGDQLFVIWAGLGDFLNSDGVLAVPDPSDLVARLTSYIETLADAAAEDAELKILVANLPPMGQTVRSKWLGDSVNPAVPELLDRLSSRTNNLLSTELRMLSRERGIEIIELDVFELSQEIAADPAAFGFINADDPARAVIDQDGQPVDVSVTAVGTVINPDDHLYYDDVYPTRKWHELVAARALEKLLANSP
jgi:phospholipase/lecithinase/hemolysin